jgi:predicted nucleic acid-binding protein
VYLLDTDTLSLALHRSEQFPGLASRILAESPDRVSISIITVEEVLRGALDSVRKDQRTPRVVKRYRFLQEVLEAVAEFNVLPYDDAAQAIFQNLGASTKRIGTQDCRIACVALALGCTVVTRNTAHFSQIAGIQLEDWTL